MEMKMIESLDPIDSNAQTQIPIIISRQLKKISTLTKSQALYSQVIQKNFEIINDLLKKLQIVFSSTIISIFKSISSFNYSLQTLVKVFHILLLSGLGNIEADVESIHNEHRRNNFHLTTNIEDIKFSISGIDSQVKMIYQDYKKKGFSTFVKSCSNLNSQSSISNSDNFNRKTMDETTHKNSENLNNGTNQLQPGQWGRNLTIAKLKQERSKVDGNLRKNKRKRSYKKNSLRQSLNTKFEENEQYVGSENLQNMDGCYQNVDMVQSDEINKQNSQEGNEKNKIYNLDQMRSHNKGKMDSKYSQIARDLSHGLIAKKESKNYETSKMNAEGNLGMKMITQKYKQIHRTTNISRYKSQMNCLPHNFDYQPSHKQDTEVVPEGINGQKRKYTQNFIQNYHQKNGIASHSLQYSNFALQLGTTTQDYLHRLEGLIGEVNHKVGEVAKKLNDVIGKCQNFVTMEKYASDMYSQFNQIKANKIFSIQNFANKSETKKALLFINDKIKSFIQLNFLDSPQNSCSLPNCSESPQTGPSSTIISKCLGCNRFANLIEDSKKRYTISPKSKLNQNTEGQNTATPMTISEIKKRAMSALKSSQKMNRKKFSKYEAS